MITVESLRIEISNLEQQKQQAIVTIHQADGAIALAQAMIVEIEQDTEVTLEQFAEAIEGSEPIAAQEQ